MEFMLKNHHEVGTPSGSTMWMEKMSESIGQTILGLSLLVIPYVSMQLLNVGRKVPIHLVTTLCHILRIKSLYMKLQNHKKLLNTQQQHT